jgi:hypothetical protein
MEETMTQIRRVAATMAGVAIIALSLLLFSGAMTATASPGPIRVHIDIGVVTVGHGLACYVQEGNVEAEGTSGKFVANLKNADPGEEGRPCGTIHGDVTFEAHPHGAGFFGSWSGVVTRHSGPQPSGDFTGAFMTGMWMVRAPVSGTVKGEGTLNITLF